MQELGSTPNAALHTMQDTAPPPAPFAPWLVRLLLAAALMIGAEVLFWNDPITRAASEWLLLVPGYVALAALSLDVLVRYRVRDFWGVMTLAGVCGLVIGSVLNPATGLADVPRTLVTRVTGAYTLLSLEMIVLFLALTGARQRGLRWSVLLGSAAVGLAWGTWTRYAPGETDIAFALIPLETMLAWGAGSAALLLGLYALTLRFAAALPAERLRLDVRMWAVVLPTLAVLVLLRLIEGTATPTSLILIAILMGLCWGILWYRRSTKKAILLEAHFPIQPLPLLWIVLAAAILFWTAVFSYSLPVIGTAEFNQLSIVVYGFTLYGLAWLPTVSLILGARAYIRQIQSARL